jgi:crotonobetainyl-CoA:carnitine CoA-transferase CaiB-like acyl-CoA transferase
MSKPMAGVRILEVAAWTFVPAAGAVFADWGADVIKIEHPELGDPQRGLSAMGIIPGGDTAVNYIIEQPNRGKRSVGLDISTDAGRELLYALAKESDVFLTSFLPQVRRKLKIDVDDIRAANPNIIYVRGSGQGAEGPDAEKGGYDGASYWARGGVGQILTPPDREHPIAPRPAFGDLAGAITIAGGIAAALYEREKTGHASVVDISLLGLATWILSPDIVASGLYGGDPMPKFDRTKSPNPLVGNYKTSDGRFITLMMLQGDRFWEEFVRLVGKDDWLTDEKMVDGGARFMNSEYVIGQFDELFASRSYEQWKQDLAPLSGVWAPMQEPAELFDDPMVQANGYLNKVTDGHGQTYDLVDNPVHFDGEHNQLKAAPTHGEHTDEVLLEVLGLDYDTIIEHKTSGAVL